MEHYDDRLTALCGIGPTVRKLLAIHCAGQADAAGLADIFSAVDIEKLPPQITGLLAAASASGEYAGVPEGVVPRLRGIIKYMHTVYAGMSAGLCALGKRCNEAGIPVLLTGATAVRFAYSTQPRQHTWSTELCIPGERYASALDLAREEGCTVEETRFGASIRRQKTEAMVIRRKNEKNSFLWDEAAPFRVGAAVFLRPERSRLLVSLLEDGVCLLHSANPGSNLVRWTADLHAVAVDANWQAVAALSAQRGSVPQCRLMLEIYQHLAGNASGKIPLDIFGSRGDTEPLLELLEALHLLPPKRSFRRLWLVSRLDVPGFGSARAILHFFRRLSLAVWYRLTPGR